MKDPKLCNKCAATVKIDEKPKGSFDVLFICALICRNWLHNLVIYRSNKILLRYAYFC